MTNHIPPITTDMADLVPLLVTTLTDPDALTAMAPADSLALLNRTRLARLAMQEAEERLIVANRDRTDNPASWGDLAEALGVSRATAKERYERILSANRLNRSDVWFNENPAPAEDYWPVDSPE